MDFREELVKLLKAVPTREGGYCDLEDVADYLIAHGVKIPVLCKDCEHCGEFENWAKRKYLGCNWIPGEIHEVDPEHSCSYGKRRNNV